MPGLITHHYILMRALAELSGAASPISAVRKSHERVRFHASQPDGYKQYKTDPDCLVASCAYIGSSGPDMFYLEFMDKGTFIADLMHYNKTGLYPIFLLRQVKQQLRALNAGLRFDLLNLLGYALGYISHIAADITVHPYVNSIVGAYADNLYRFRNNNSADLVPSWKFHNILEHYQDTYVMHRLFFGQEKFQKDWNFVNVPAGAAAYYCEKAQELYRFMTNNAKEFYGFTIGLDDDIEFEWDKYRFFVNENVFMNVGTYYKKTIPSVQDMAACPRLVQGGTFDDHGRYMTRGLFDNYLERAVKQTTAFWGEVDDYLRAPQEDFSEPDFLVEKRCFKTLRRHWNLDCGLAPVATSSNLSWDVPGANNTKLFLTGKLSFASTITSEMGDINWP